MGGILQSHLYIKADIVRRRLPHNSNCNYIIRFKACKLINQKFITRNFHAVYGSYYVAALDAGLHGRGVHFRLGYVSSRRNVLLRPDIIRNGGSVNPQVSPWVKIGKVLDKALKLSDSHRTDVVLKVLLGMGHIDYSHNLPA